MRRLKGNILINVQAKYESSYLKETKRNKGYTFLTRKKALLARRNRMRKKTRQIITTIFF